MTRPEIFATLAPSTEAFAPLSERDRERLIDTLSVVRAHVTDLADSPPPESTPRRRPRR